METAGVRYTLQVHEQIVGIQGAHLGRLVFLPRLQHGPHAQCRARAHAAQHLAIKADQHRAGPQRLQLGQHALQHQIRPMDLQGLALELDEGTHAGCAPQQLDEVRKACQPLAQVPERQLVHRLRQPVEAQQVAVMVQHRHRVLGQQHIALDKAHTARQSGLKRGQRVLGSDGRQAAVGDDFRKGHALCPRG